MQNPSCKKRRMCKKKHCTFFSKKKRHLNLVLFTAPLLPSFSALFFKIRTPDWKIDRANHSNIKSCDVITSVISQRVRRCTLPKSQCVFSCPPRSPCRAHPSPPTRSPPTGQCRPGFAPQRSPRAPPLDWIVSDGASFTECLAVRAKVVVDRIFEACGKPVLECQ